MNYAREINLKKNKYYESLEKEYCTLSENMDNEPSKETMEEMQSVKKKLDLVYI